MSGYLYRGSPWLEQVNAQIMAQRSAANRGPGVVLAVEAAEQQRRKRERDRLSARRRRREAAKRDMRDLLIGECEPGARVKTADADTRCDYHEREFRCADDAEMEIKIDGKPAKLCKRHLKPEYHPQDIRRMLPGKIAMALRRFK